MPILNSVNTLKMPVASGCSAMLIFSPVLAAHQIVAVHVNTTSNNKSIFVIEFFYCSNMFIFLVY